MAIVHADVAANRAILHDRLVSTADKLGATASAYVEEDDNSAAEIAAVGAPRDT